MKVGKWRRRCECSPEQRGLGMGMCSMPRLVALTVLSSWGAGARALRPGSFHALSSSRPCLSVPFSSAEDLSISRPLLLHAAYTPRRWLCHRGPARAKCRNLDARGALVFMGSPDPAKACEGSLRIPEHQQGAKQRREWQMERAFQTALWVLQPEVIFILGDIFDEGKWSSPQAWADDLGRFQKMFRHPSHMQLKVVAGNHDIGFHYWMSSYTVQRFEKAFSAERLFSQKGVNFVMVNSVAMEGDSCSICAVAEAELLEISRLLNCSREVRGSGPCGAGQRLPPSAPVLLQHYPLYRASDANCSGPDAAPPEERSIPFKERYDALSQEASQKLLWWFRPRLVLSGHTHSACEVLHSGRIRELSVPSFSWRNRNNPSFVMASLTSHDYALSKCFLPQEDTVLATYCGVAGLLAAFGLAHAGRWALPFLSGWTALRTHRAR
ncbi:metallophosphoesterase 1 isoform X2 [Octodon degus]|uniref:Metallophosphoesterase 1 n=1 Tax=Octodon degus TaxID=10160 RepID=A0A6P6DTE1_OCTDE|nr:metallophosphoesterase 1 isoform X2 [Octodon degus]